VPELLRRRGRTYQALGDLDRAAADFEAAVAEIERHRETLREGEDRWGVFHASEELFADAIELATLRHDAQTAFDYAERSRARALFDTLASKWRRVTPADVPEGTAIVEYAVQANATYVFVVSDGAVRVSRQRLQRTEVVAGIVALVDASEASDGLRARRAGTQLYRLLIEPVANVLPRKSRLVIVPDPTLGCVPFAALLDGKGRYLVETHTLTTEPSAAFFTRARHAQRSHPQNALVIFGAEGLGRLEAAEREARAVARIYPHATFLSGERATADAFRREAANADIVDFAGHSVASTRGTRDSYLLLGGRNAPEAHFEAREIAAMTFPKTSLVVLAACATATGEVRATEGSISVARSFLAAGVPSVIATLWPIDDAAAASFFVALHSRVAQGMPAAEALQATQVEWIRRDQRSPAMWAAVQIIGE
jgi:CHAT domain-containing protein